MARSKSSKTWLREHVNDAFVKRAAREGLRSRAAYKLAEINERDKLVRRGMWVVDLGAAPGGWSQLVAPLVGPEGKVIALDMLDMEPIPNVEFIQGDFGESTALERLEESLGGHPVDLVLSDMAPNISGVRSTDQARWEHLSGLALDFAREYLRPGGALLIKCFQGAGVDELRRELGQLFDSLVVRKPEASRDRSREFFLLARGRKGGPAQPASQDETV